ncbi:MAG: NADP-dependent oxidoreductase [Rhodospirillales bacterium]|nr:NADP-dependent oxidoreductase [Rhodospirillales bacterium]MDE0380644.1 NADP-dependent oxidoreductase [Rhodospirillales bacterium]
MNAAINRRITLAARPVGMPKESDFALAEEPVPEPRAGQALVRVLYLSLDPYMRGRMSAAKSYAAPVDIGGVMTGGAVGEVVRSETSGLKEGDLVEGMFGWQEYALCTRGAVRVLPEDGHPPSYTLGVLGMPGATAYFGLLEVGQPHPGDTVVVSAASGAVGAVVGQIAKIGGCRVVGTVGSDEKAAYITDELGFDAAINYRTANDIGAALDAACPAGIDVYFDNVGGPMTDAVMQRLAFKARVVVCGCIHHYNLTEPYLGPSHLRHILVNRARVEGFLVFDWLARYPEAFARLGAWLEDGAMRYREHVLDGLENAPEGLGMLFEGSNFGKLVVKVAER